MVDHHQQLQKEHNIYSCHRVALLVVDICLCLNLKSCFVLLNTSSRSARCWLVSTVSIILALCCSTPRVTLLILDLSPSFRLNFSCFVFLNPSTRSTRCKVVSGSSLNTLTFVVPVLVSFSPVWQPNLLLLMFHSLKLLSISTFFSSLSIRFLSCCFLYFCYCFPRCLTVPNLRTPSHKRTVYRTQNNILRSHFKFAYVTMPN